MTDYQSVKDALTGITISRAKALLALAKSKKEYPDTDDIRDATGFDSTQLGGLASALTKMTILGEQLLTVRPVRIDRNTTQYIWNREVATKEQVLKVLKEFGMEV